MRTYITTFIMRSYITAFMLAITLALASCGGGNDVASSGASAVSAAAPPLTTTTASAPSTAATEPKVNGQVDERTGVAPVGAKMTVAPTVATCLASSNYGGTGPLLTAYYYIAYCAAALPGFATGNPWTPYLNGGCANSNTFGGSGPALSSAQQSICNYAIQTANQSQCSALGGWWAGIRCSEKGDPP